MNILLWRQCDLKGRFICTVCGRLHRDGESAGVWAAQQQQLSPLASVTPAYPALYCRQNTPRQNINISKTSSDNSHPLYFSLHSFCPLFHFFLFALWYFAISSWSLLDSPALPRHLSSRENIVATRGEGWQQWSGHKSQWLLVLDLVDGKRANVIVQALVTVDTGSSEGSVI